MYSVNKRKAAGQDITVIDVFLEDIEVTLIIAVALLKHS